jgi:hypothetical protein
MGIKMFHTSPLGQRSQKGNSYPSHREVHHIIMLPILYKFTEEQEELDHEGNFP